MKSMSLKNGQLGLLLTLSVLASACNPEEYFPIEEMLTGEDAYCYEAKDLNSCQALAPRCQPAYMDQADETVEPEFAFCISNPGYLPPSDGSTDGSTDGSSDGSTGGTTDGSTGGTTDGSTGGTTDGSTGGSSDGSDDGSSEPVAPPTLQDALKAKCENVPDEYLWIKKELKKNKVIKVIKKIKLCHSTGNGDAHTIIVACPALKAHTKHHKGEDYIGACSL